MYWWNIKKLRAELIARTLTEQTRFWYLFCGAMATSVLLEFRFVSEDITLRGKVVSVVMMSSTALGTVLAYRSNGGAAGHSFLERYMSIGWVCLMRVLVLFVPVILTVYVLAALLGIPIEEKGSYLDTAITLLLVVVYYAGLCRHIRFVANEERSAAVSAE